MMPARWSIAMLLLGAACGTSVCAVTEAQATIETYAQLKCREACGCSSLRCSAYASCQRSEAMCGEPVGVGLTVETFSDVFGPTLRKEYGPLGVTARTTLLVETMTPTVEPGAEPAPAASFGELMVRFVWNPGNPNQFTSGIQCVVSLTAPPPQRCSLVAPATDQAAYIAVHGGASSRFAFRVERVNARPHLWDCGCVCPSGMGG